jgi:uncharacterized protein YoxC
MAVETVGLNTRIQARERVNYFKEKNPTLGTEEKQFLEKVLLAGSGAHTELQKGLSGGTIDPSIFQKFTDFLSSVGHLNESTKPKSYSAETFKSDIAGVASSVQSSLTKLKSVKDAANATNATAQSIFEAIQKLPAAFRNIQEIKDFVAEYNAHKGDSTPHNYSHIGDIKTLDIGVKANSLDLHSGKKLSAYFDISADGSVKLKDDAAATLHTELGLTNLDDITNEFRSFYASLLELGHDSPSDNLRRLHAGGDLEGFETTTSPTEKPTHTADPTALEAALKAEAKIFHKEADKLPALVADGKIDWKAVQEFKNGFANHKVDDKEVTKEAQVAKLVAILKEHGTGLSDLTPENLDAKITEMLKKSDGDGKGWGETLLNIGKTALTSGVIVAAAIFFIVTGQLDKLKKLISGKADQQEVVQLAQQIMTTEQQQLAALTKEVISLKNNLKTETTNRTSGKKSQRKKPIPHRNNAPEGHETTRMNAPAKQATIRMKAPEDGVDGVPTDNGLPQDDQIDGAPTDNDLPSDDQIDGAPTENDLPSDDQVDNGLNDNDGNNQVGDEDGGDSAANSTIDGQPNSTRPMEGEGNNIVPKSKRVYISRGDGQPINVTKHAPAAVTTINFESDRYGNIPKKVTNKGGGDFDNE